MQRSEIVLQAAKRSAEADHGGKESYCDCDECDSTGPVVTYFFVCAIAIAVVVLVAQVLP